jgi:hypothetical protein
MSEEIRWEDPPLRSYRGGETIVGRIRTALTENPGRWALVRELVNPGTKSHLERALGPHFEVTSRKRDGTHMRDIYARYIGPAA